MITGQPRGTDGQTAGTSCLAAGPATAEPQRSLLQRYRGLATVPLLRSGCSSVVVPCWVMGQ
jgi:hypothetical protein